MTTDQTRPAVLASGNRDIAAVIVAYRPEPVLFSRVLRAVVNQVARVVIVDNGGSAGAFTQALLDPKISLVEMGGNKGVAAAQNAGIERARQLGAAHVLLLDHDSVCAPEMVRKLFDAWVQLRESGEKVAAVGANHLDPRRPLTHAFTRIEGLTVRRLTTDSAGVVHRIPIVISSGCLIAFEALDTIGLMEEMLFIDYVDTEWGLRAQTHGWSSFGVVDARMEHTLGDEPLKIFGRAYASHGPLRHYYMARNGVWMIMNRANPTNWRVLEVWRLLRRSTAYLIFAPHRMTRLSMMGRGIRDGLWGRMGAYEDRNTRRK